MQMGIQVWLPGYKKGRKKIKRGGRSVGLKQTSHHMHEGKVMSPFPPWAGKLLPCSLLISLPPSQVWEMQVRTSSTLLRLWKPKVFFCLFSSKHHSLFKAHIWILKGKEIPSVICLFVSHLSYLTVLIWPVQEVSGRTSQKGETTQSNWHGSWWLVSESLLLGSMPGASQLCVRTQMVA